VDDRLGKVSVSSWMGWSTARGCRGGDLLEAHRATMSPVRMVSRSSRLFACINKRRPRRSFFMPFVVFTTVVALFEGARVDAQVRQLTDVGVGHDLEGQRREGLVVAGLALDDVFFAGLGALGRRRSTGEGR